MFRLSIIFHFNTENPRTRTRGPTATRAKGLRQKGLKETLQDATEPLGGVAFPDSQTHLSRRRQPTRSDGGEDGDAFSVAL